MVDDTFFALFPGITPGITSRGTGQPNVVDDTSGTTCKVYEALKYIVAHYQVSACVCERVCVCACEDRPGVLSRTGVCEFEFRLSVSFHGPAGSCRALRGVCECARACIVAH